MMKVEYGTTLETATDSYTVLEPAGEGGFGTVYRVSREGDGKIFAVKFMQEPDVSGYRPKLAYECQSKVRRIFEEECWFLEKLGYLESKRRPLPFPRFYGKGELHGTPFYVMEWLEPVDLAAHKNDVKRIGYLSQVCHAVDILHREGYVHYDIKPGNIMRCELSEEDNRNGYTYVLVDFGSVHRAEEHTRSPEEDRRRRVEANSYLSNGSHLRATTRGYADPYDDRHTIHADIYALGQVIRDLFREEVPFTWGAVINKCTSRYYGYRYADVRSLLHDICHLRDYKEKIYQQLRRERLLDCFEEKRS